jgi:cysteine desulfurase
MYLFNYVSIGTDDEMAHSSIRFGIGRFTTEEEVDLAVELLIKHVNRLREMSPLWEMVYKSLITLYILYLFNLNLFF